MPDSLRRSLFAAVVLSHLGVATAAAQSGSITGRITDASTGTPLATVEIQVLGGAGGSAGRALSTVDGQYRVPSVSPGTYRVVASMTGYATVEEANVTVVAGQPVTVNFALRPTAVALNPVVVSVGREPERLIESPASITVVSEREIDERPAVTPADHLRNVPGVDIITTGIQSTNVATRGFNNIFSGSLHMLTDNRIAGVPSLRVNLLHFTPATNDDLERMEVVLGPGSAIYGPNTASGVLHMMTRSPLSAQGTTFSITGGERELLHGTFRTSQRIGETVGVKLSGQYFAASDWAFLDPDELAERQRFATDSLGIHRQDMIAALGISSAEAERRIALIGARDDDLRRWSGEARVDWRPTDEFRGTLQTGLSHSSSGVELTGLGAAQVNDWRYAYYQARATWNRLFAQVYLNTSDAGDTYLLRTGQPVTDRSRLLVGQLQHGFALGGRQNFTYGVDYFFTDPRTEGTISGIYEDEDETTEVGGYLQSQTALSPRFDLVLAGRVDTHSALPDAIFSPRAALVFKPTQDQAFRATFNRAFSTPTSLNQFLDLPTSMPDQATNPVNAAAARLGYSVRVQGTGTTGFRFQQDGGGYLMRVPAQLGGPNQILPANVAPFWGAAVAVAAQQAPQLAPLAQYLASLQPTAADIGTNALIDGVSLPLSQVTIPDIAPIRETTTTTFEVGYKGIVAQRVALAADVWHTTTQDFVTPLTVSTPLLALNGPQIAAFLVPRLMADLGYSQEDATALATQVAGGMAMVPLGVITAPAVNATGAQLLATYTNVNEKLNFWGVDLAATAMLTDNWSLQGTASLVSDDHFDTSVGTVTLNAPRQKGSLAAQFRSIETAGFNGELRVRYNNEFPVQSGVYQGTACIVDTPADPCVSSYTLLDLMLGYTLPAAFRGAALQLSVQNLLDEDYRSYPGTPAVGRLALLRLRYTF